MRRELELWRAEARLLGVSFLKARDAGMELSKRRIRRTVRRLGMATMNELEKRRRDNDAS